MSSKGTGAPVDLRQVLYFATVAAELSFTRAAARLHISAPALSQQVKALERHLGVQLLVRDTRHVRLTDAGKLFAERGRALLEAGEVAVREARGSAGIISGRLQLAALHEAEGAFEPLLTGFHTAHPHVEVRVMTMRHAELIGALCEGTLDAALTWDFLLERAENGQGDGVRWLGVCEVEVLAAMGRRGSLAADERVPRGPALRGVPTVLFERPYSPVSFDYAVDQLYGPGCPDPPVREIPVTVRTQEAMAREVADSGGLAPLSRPIADILGDDWRIRPFEPPWHVEARVVWRPEHRSAALSAFVAQARAQGAQPSGGPRTAPS